MTAEFATDESNKTDKINTNIFFISPHSYQAFYKGFRKIQSFFFVSKLLIKKIFKILFEI